MTVPFGLGYEMTSLEKDRKLLRQDDSGALHCESAPVLQQNAQFSPLEPPIAGLISATNASQSRYVAIWARFASETHLPSTH